MQRSKRISVAALPLALLLGCEHGQQSAPPKAADQQTFALKKRTVDPANWEMASHDPLGYHYNPVESQIGAARRR